MFLALTWLSLPVLATGEVAQTFTLDGRLYADSAGTTPLTDSDVTVVLQILNPAQDCILYEETQTHFNAAIGNGYFTFQVGSVVGAAKRSSLDSAHSMASVYSNTTGTVSGRTIGGAACSYNPSPGEPRYVRILVTPSSDGVTRTLSPNMTLNSVPNAVIAESAESVQGVTASQLLQVNTTGSEVLSQSNLENVFSSSNYSALTSLLSGSSSMYSKAASNGTSVLPNVSSPSTPAAGQMWYDGGAIKYYDGSSTQTLGTAGSGITSLTIGTGLTPTGTISSSGSIAVDVGTTAGKIVQVASGDKLPAIDGSALTNLNGSAVNSGTIGGTTAVNTSGNITTTGTLSSGAITSSDNITTTGDVSANDISASGNANITGNVVASGNGSFAAVSSGQISLFDSATTNTNYVTLKTPATGTLTSDYTLTLPPALPGAPGQVLTSDTSGVLSWSSPSTGSVTSVTSAGAPIVIGGSASAPTVGVNAATTAASGVVQLAASGGTTAGTVVQANDTRLSDSRAPSGGASGDLAGSYPSPTVAGIQGKTVTYTTLTTGDHLKYDGSGWVNAALSAADLSDNSDLLKASNMPANCSAGSSLTFSSPTGTWVCSTIPDATASSKGIMQVGSGLSVSSGTVSLNLSSSDVTTALGYTPVDKAGDTMTGALGLASYTNTTEATLVGSLGTSDKGKTWFNSDILQIRMWDGTQVVDVAAATAPTSSEDGKSLRWNQTSKSWEYFTAGAAGAGIGTLNGLTANTQNFAIGTSGTAPAFSSTTATHTLNIPMASTSSVTAGLISKTDYDNFSNKLGTSSTFSGDVSGTSSTTSVDKIKGKAVTAPTTAGQYLVYDGTEFKPVVMSGDATMIQTGAITLKNTGTAGTYYKVTTDAQGRVTSGNASLSASDIPNLDWSKITSGTPTTLSGYGITDAVKNAGATPSIESGLAGSIPSAGTAGRVYIATDTKKIYRDNGSSWDLLSASNSGTVTSVTSGGIPIVVGGTASDPTISVNAATTSATGVVQLATNGGTTSGTAVQADDARLSDSRAPSGGASGDLSGTYPSPTVAKLNGKSVTYTSITAGDFLKYDGSGWVNAALSLSSSDLSDASTLIKSTQMPASCGADHTLTFSSPTGTWSCTSIALDAAAITSGTIADARLPASAKYWQAATGGINYAGGNVGVGTTNPVATLDVSGSIGVAWASSTKSNGIAYLPDSQTFDYTNAQGTYKLNHYGMTVAQTPTSAATYLSGHGEVALFTNGLNRLHIKGNGNVGIGTTAPLHTLEIVNSSSDASLIRVAGSSSGTGGGYLSSYGDNHLNIAGGAEYNGSAWVARATSASMFGISGGGFGFLTNTGLTPGNTFSPTYRLYITPAGNVGVGTTTPTQALEVNGNIKGTQLCIGTDCRSAWPGSGGGGTVTSVGSGTGLTGGPITGSGTLAVDVGTTAGKIVQVAAGDKLPTIDGSALTNLNASNLASGTVAAARMPALTGDVTTSAGSVATTLAQIQGKSLTVTSPSTGDYLKYNGTGWVNSTLSSSGLSDASDLLKASNMPANCSASQTLTFSSPTGTWVCSNIAIDAAAITSGTIADARLPASAKYWQSVTGGINYSGGNVGIGTTTPGAKLHIAGTAGVDGIMFPDGTVQTSAAIGAGVNNTIVTSFPDAILCSNGTTSVPLYLYTKSSTIVGYRYIQNNAGDTYLQYNASTGAYSSVSGLSGYDCVTNTWSISQLYAQGRAFNFAKGPAAQWLQSGSNAYYNAGNVGIGTATPASTLQVYDSTGYPTIQFGTWSFLGTGASGYPYFGFGTKYNKTTTQWDTNHTTVPGMIMRFNSAGMLFDYLPANTTNASPTTAMAISSSTGNVGIGTATPSSLLHIASTSNALMRLDSGAGLASGIYHYNGATAGGGLTLFPASDSRVFSVVKSDVNNSNAPFTVLQNGNVGIGTTSPPNLLSVANSSGGASVSFYGADTSQTGLNIGVGLNNRWLLYQDTAANGRFFSLWHDHTGVGGSYGSVLSVTTAGKIGIGTASPQGLVDMHAAMNGTNRFVFTDTGAGHQWELYPVTSAFQIYDRTAGTGVSLANGATSWAALSDGRLKKNIKTLSVLDRLDKYRAVSFDWKKSGKRDIGVVAQELYKVFPEAVEKGSDDPEQKISDITSPGVWTVRYAPLGAVALEGVKEISQRIDMSEAPTRAPTMKLNGDGSVDIAGSLWLGGNIAQASDARLKRDVQPIPDALRKIDSLQGVTYYWKDSNRSAREQLGVIAQEVEKVFPQAVSEDRHGIKSVTYSALIAPIIQAIKELTVKWSGDHAEIEKLKAENHVLKTSNDQLKAWACSKDPGAPFCPTASH